MKVHDEFESLTDVYLAGGLEPDERAAVEEHAGTCAACGRVLRDAGAFHGWVKGLAAPGAPPADLENRIIANLRARTHRRAPKVLKLLAGLAAVFALVIIGGLFTKSDSARTLVTAIAPGKKADGDGLVYDEKTGHEVKFLRHTHDVDGYAGDTSIEGKELMSGWGHEGSGYLALPSGGFSQRLGDRDDSERSATGVGGGAGGGERARVTGGLERKTGLADARPASTPPPSKPGGAWDDKQPGFSKGDFEDHNESAEAEKGSNQRMNLEQDRLYQEQENQRLLKIIRNGELHLEVDSYTETYNHVARITREKKGFVAGANSTKLANGKTRATITLRVPPELFEEALDALAALGLQRHRNITTTDVTKHYTDLSSRLDSKKTLVERLKKVLLEGKGSVKELMEVEVQMSAAVEQMELIKGEMKYYDNLVGLSTITLQVFEKDLGLPFEYIQTLQSNIGVTADEVDAAYAQAQKIVLDAKGQVVESRMTRTNEDTATGFVRAKVDADAFPAVREALKKLGQVDQDTVNQQQTGRGGQGDAKPGAPVKKEQAVIDFTVNTPPVVFTKQANLGVEASKVEETYQAARREIEAKGKITGGSISDRTDGAKAWVRGQVDAADFPALVEKLKGLGKVKRAAVEQIAEAGGDKKVRQKGEIVFEITAPPALIPEESGVGKVLRETFTASIAGVLWSFEKLVVGIALAGPWIVLALLVVLVWRRARRRKSQPA